MEVSFELNKINEVDMKEVCNIAEKINKLETDISKMKSVMVDCDKLILQRVIPYIQADAYSCKTDYMKHEYVEDMHTNLGEAIKKFIIGYKRSEIDSLERDLQQMGVKIRRDIND